MGLSPPVALLPCAFLERATAHILLGWLPKVVDIDVKLALAKHQHQAMTRAIQLERMIRSLGRTEQRNNLSVPRRWRDTLEDVDRCVSETEMLARLFLEVKP